MKARMSDTTLDPDPCPDPGAGRGTEPETDHVASIDDGADEAQRVVPVLAETLEVQRRALPGSVRIRKRVEEQPATIDEVLTDETVEVERVAVGRVLDGPAEMRPEGDTLIVPVVAEELVIVKRRVLTEELHIRRTTRTRHHQSATTLRREHLSVERQDARTGAWRTVEVPPATDPASDPEAAARRDAPERPAPSATDDVLPKAAPGAPR